MSKWEFMYQEAAKYADDHGDLDVPARYVTEDGYPLGRWLMTQRNVYTGKSSGRLTQEQAKMLENIGMRWENAADAQWEHHFAAAKAYYEKFGNLEVRTDYVTEDGFALGQWISSVRAGKKNEKRLRYLTEERLKELESIGMVWEQQNSSWNQKYAAAKRYYEKNGHLKVPMKYVDEDGFPLGKWILQMRNTWNQGKPIAEERIAQLDAIGMIWKNKDTRAWEKGISELEAYVAEHGNADVPKAYISRSGYRLGKWVEEQRRKNKEGKLSEAEKERLGIAS